jgi:hypothetical protein
MISNMKGKTDFFRKTEKGIPSHNLNRSLLLFSRKAENDRFYNQV